MIEEIMTKKTTALKITLVLALCTPALTHLAASDATKDVMTELGDGLTEWAAIYSIVSAVSCTDQRIFFAMRQ